MITQRCNAMRTIERKGVLPGYWKTRRCWNRATKSDTVFQTDGHQRLADGWFLVWICDACRKRSEA